MGTFFFIDPLKKFSKCVHGNKNSNREGGIFLSQEGGREGEGRGIT